MVTIGYNRRFAPMTLRMKDHMDAADEPVTVQVRVNAGAIPPGHWIHDPEVGGGRIVGEVCHFVDLACALTGAIPVDVYAQGIPDGGRYREDNLILTMGMSNGSVASIVYVASGNRALGKERVEVFGGGRAAVLDDFRSLRLFGGARARTYRDRFGQDKGHRGEWEVLVRALKGGGESPIALDSWVATSLATFVAVQSLRSGQVEKVDTPAFMADLGGGLAEPL